MPFLVAIVLGVFVLQITMAKELPYYQFEPAEYLAGDISFCTIGAQGLFSNMCAYYWQRECKLTRDQFLRRLNHPKLFDELVSEGIIDLKENDIIIKFLDAQYEKATTTSKTNSINGSKGGRPKKETEIKPNLKPNDNPNESETKGIREDKIREDKIREEKKKQEDKPPKPKKVFSQEVYDCYYSILPHFDESTKPKENQVDSWLDTIEKLNRIDGYDFNDIIHLVSKTREDTFWQSNFLSINKLRQKNKDGITYWNVFYNKFKQTNSNNSSYDINELIRRKLEDPTL